MPLSLDEELRAIQELTDVTRVQSKKTSRKGQLTKLGSQLRTMGDTSFDGVRIADVQKKLQEAVRSAALFAALQERHEALLEDAKATNLDEEIANGEAIREENERIVEKAEVLVEKYSVPGRSNVDQTF